MICNRRSKAIDPFSKPVNCKYYIKVSKADAGIDEQPVPYELGFCQFRDQFLCIEDIPARSPRLSHSSISDFMDCRRMYYLKHIRGIERIPSTFGDALKMGVLWDRVLQLEIGNLTRQQVSDTITEYEIPEMAVAKVKAVARAFRTLDIRIDPFCKTQPRFILPLHYEYAQNDFIVTGLYDRLYEDHFVESKFSKNVEYYTSLYTISPQVGTYFLADPGLSHCIMEVVRTPDLKSTKSHKDESAASLEERTYQDIITRPAYYFIGWSPETKTFGRKFYRSEFDLKEVEQRYASIFYEIADCANRDAFYKDHKRCLFPWRCDFLEICWFNTISESMFRIKDKPLEVGAVDYDIERLVNKALPVVPIPIETNPENCLSTADWDPETFDVIVPTEKELPDASI